MTTPLQYAETRLGDPYVYAATGPNAFDCSGLTQWAYGQAGIKIPRTSQEQRNAGTVINLASAQPGDLLTFSYPGESGNPAPGNHVAMYVSPGREIEAAHPGTNVRYSGIDTGHLDRVVHIPGSPSTIDGQAPSTTGLGVLAQNGIDGSTWPGNVMSSATWDPFGIGSGVTSVASSVVASILKALGPIMLTGISLTAAAALIVGGLWRMTEPSRTTATKAATTGAMFL